MLRKTSTLLNIVVVCVSSFMFAYTFFAQQQVTDRVRAFVFERTLAYSRPTVEWAERGLKSPLAGKLISPGKKKAIEDEVAKYNRDPEAYVASVTNQADSPTEPAVEGGKIEGFKQKIRDHYDSTLQELVIDLRIFTGSNVAAGLVGLFLLLSRRFRARRQVEVFSLFLFASVILSAWSYLDGSHSFGSCSSGTWAGRIHAGWRPRLCISSTIMVPNTRKGE